jgi:hypothetical protein
MRGLQHFTQSSLEREVSAGLRLTWQEQQDETSERWTADSELHGQVRTRTEHQLTSPFHPRGVFQALNLSSDTPPCPTTRHEERALI